MEENKEVLVVDATQQADWATIEAALVQGDLAGLTPQQRVMHYNRTCESIGVNPLMKPFDYIKLNGKVTLYALKSCTEQLRARRGVSITKLEKDFSNDLFIVTAYATTSDGKCDVSTGACSIAGLKGEALANALMKAETKAKRRVTLSVCGLGWLDESEVSSIPEARVGNEAIVTQGSPMPIAESANPAIIAAAKAGINVNGKQIKIYCYRPAVEDHEACEAFKRMVANGKAEYYAHHSDSNESDVYVSKAKGTGPIAQRSFIKEVTLIP